MAGVHPGDITWHRLIGLIAKRIIPDPTEGTRGMQDASPEDGFGLTYGTFDVCPIQPSSPPRLNVEVASLFDVEACVCNLNRAPRSLHHLTNSRIPPSGK